MKAKFLLIFSLFTTFATAYSQEYAAHTYLGIRRNFGTLTNGYTNAGLKGSTEKIGINILEFSTEGMDKNHFVRFNTDFFGIFPDYIIKAMSKKNTATIHGESLDNFREEYNQIPGQYEYNASFNDWDVLGGNISYGYKYVFAGVNFAWASTGLGAYQSVSNIKIKKQAPPDFYSFNTDGNFSYGLNMVFGNNKPEKPIRLIAAYDLMLMRDANNNWIGNKGNRLNFDLQGNWPAKFNKDKWGIYAALSYRIYDIQYVVSDNGVLLNQDFSASIFALRAGISW